MNELQDEIQELKGFIEELKNERAEVKAKERREAWTKYVSLTIVVVAVITAIATQWANKYAGRTLICLNNSTFFQAKASDQWSYYQAKSIKQNLYEVSQAQNATPSPDFAAKIAKYEKDKKEIRAGAEALEKQRDEARQASSDASDRGAGMSLAVAILSISIALASICTMTKKKPLWFVSIILAFIAVGEMVMVWVK